MKTPVILKDLLLIGLLACVVNTAVAKQDIQVVTNISVDVSNIDIKVKESFSNSGNATWDGSTEKRTIKSGSASSTLGVSVIKGKLSVGLTTLISGTEPSEIEGKTSLAGGSSRSNVVDATISRTSYSLLAGYSFHDDWSAYGGYTFSATQVGSTFTFEDNGIFLGAKHYYRIGASNSLVFNAAYSISSSSIELKNNSLLNNYQIEGDSQGISLGATWLYSLDRGRSFYVRVKYTKFEFDDTKNGVSPALSTTGDVAVDATQTYTTLSLGMGF